jgi:hypothetical protein
MAEPNSVDRFARAGDVAAGGAFENGRADGTRWHRAAHGRIGESRPFRLETRHVRLACPVHNQTAGNGRGNLLAHDGGLLMMKRSGSVARFLGVVVVLAPAWAMADSGAPAVAVDAGAEVICPYDTLVSFRGDLGSGEKFQVVFPRNVPGIPAWQAWTRPIGGTFRLFDAGNTLIPTTVRVDDWDYAGTLVVVPDVAPAAGNYRLAYEDSCTVAPVETQFTLIDAAPLPTSLGTIEKVEQSQDGSHIFFDSNNGGCEKVETSTVGVTIAITPSAEITPFLGVAVLQAEWMDSLGRPVPGKAVNTSISYGMNEGVVIWRVGADSWIPCDAKMMSEYGVAGTKAAVWIRGHLYGAAEDPPPLKVEFDVACPGGPASTRTAIPCVSHASDASVTDAVAGPDSQGPAPGDKPAADAGSTAEPARADGGPAVADPDASSTAEPVPGNAGSAAEESGCAVASVGRVDARSASVFALALGFAGALKRRRREGSVRRR